MYIILHYEKQLFILYLIVTSGRVSRHWRDVSRPIFNFKIILLGRNFYLFLRCDSVRKNHRV